jgi:glycine/D-amino acid oxidase-like deaminating enzyme
MRPRSSSSLWLQTAPERTFPPVGRSIDAGVDVAVIGGGIMGLTTALLLKREGARVVVLERGEVGGAATGFTTAKVSALQGTLLSQIRRRHGDAAVEAYAQLSVLGRDRIADLVTGEGIDCELEARPAFTYAGDAAQVAQVEEEFAAAVAGGLDAELTTDVPLPFAVPAAVRLDGQLQFHPVRYARALAALVDGDGSAVHEWTTAKGVDEGRPCRVRTAEGHTVTAAHVVVATNYPLLDRGLFFARLAAARSYLVAARLRGPGPEGMLISAGEPTRSLRTSPAGGESWLLVGGE